MHSRLIFVFLISCYSFTLIAEAPPVCHKCQVIREENKKKVNPYKYYEDYLKDHPEEANNLQQDKVNHE